MAIMQKMQNMYGAGGGNMAGGAAPMGMPAMPGIMCVCVCVCVLRYVLLYLHYTLYRILLYFFL